MSWPRTQDEYLALAGQILELIGGRRDVAPAHYDFTNDDGERIKGWSPWRGRRLANDYQLQEGEKETRKNGQRYLLRKLDEESLHSHLQGKKRLGVYPLDDNDQVKLLATDFDDHSGTLDPAMVWNEVRNFWEICEANGFSAHIERSKSGTGYHVWIFFDDFVPAVKVRGIGRYLMEDAGAIRDDEDFSTFDRFFPSQPFRSGKGFGNLIGLPMFGQREYTQGKSAWVDPQSGDTIQEPIDYICTILANGRVPAGMVDEFINEDPDSITLEKKEDVYTRSARTGDEKLGTKEELEQVFARCKFMNWASDPVVQPEVSEPLWYSMISNGARFDDEDRLHEASRYHGSYSALETGNKIATARTSGPRTCKVVCSDGFGNCPKGGCALPSGEITKSPAGLGAWARPKREDTYDPGAAFADAPPEAEINETPRKTPTKANNRSVDVELTGFDPIEGTPWNKTDKDELEIYEETGQPWPDTGSQWFLSNDGLQMANRAGEPGTFIATKPIWVDSLTTDAFHEWGMVVKFFDFRWNIKSLAFPMSRLSESGGKLGMELRNQGAALVAGKEKWLCRYFDFMASQNQKFSLAATKLGWFEKDREHVFVMPEHIIGNTDQEIIFQTSMASDAKCLSPKGTLTEWQKHIADPALGNPIPMFAIMCALAGPLVKLGRGESAGFHFYGTTSGGKTTLIQMAASVWGDGTDPQEGAEHTSIRKWHSTGNALEATAQMHNDIVLCLDEISQVDPAELGNIIYMLSGGQPKARSQIEGGLKKQNTWRVLFLSNGEKTIGQILQQVGQAEKGGQRHRLPDIPCDQPDGNGSGVFLDYHKQNPKVFVDDIKDACGSYFGSAGPTFVSYLIALMKEKGSLQLIGELKERVRDLEQKLCEGINDLPNDGMRVIRRLAIVGVAGMYASNIQLENLKGAEILSWELKDIFLALAHIRNLWLKELGEERSETDRALAHFRSELLSNMAFFQNVNHEVMVQNRLGWRNEDYVMVLPKAMNHLAGDFDKNTILKEIKKQGKLKHEKDRLTYKLCTAKGEKSRPSVYWVNISFLGDVDNTPDPNAEEQAAYREAAKYL
ncbi:DUF927 domain-containing protein [Endozoicomonas gorgoniicola]|uniref:DUF927 domain-containing protein n=1 Tax=Endozoicomonas gorgoniicola TaxID=1234144 RepID=A0ABT3N1N8_9GAMM|nr:DUF927 domain-containing protein [Endozoicomonas gorgoniicola]MCW7555544.1 DUF927 domain-containing protein [Endozoicomonas gorgoniicola]